MFETVRTGDATFAFGEDMRVLTWSPAAERLTGIPAADAVGMHCWEVLGGVEPDGTPVCHADCPGARLAVGGMPPATRPLLVRSPEGRTAVSVATTVVGPAAHPVCVHVLRSTTL
jgi:PAS domain-containing protein